MEGKVKVEIFGITEESIGGGCSCGGACTPLLTMGELYKDFEEFIKKSDVKDKAELSFVDITKQDLEKYSNIKKALEIGYTLPIICIDGSPRFYGGISEYMIYDEIKKVIEQ